MSEQLENIRLITAGEFVVRIGELALVSGEGVLRTLLGSCVGLVLYDPQRQIGGLAHIVLARSHGPVENPGKFADTAIPELIRQIGIAGGRTGGLYAKFAGGADMFAAAHAATIGKQNVEAVKLLLRERKIPIIKEHCGGEQGRRMYFFPKTGLARIEIVGQTPVEL